MKILLIAPHKLTRLKDSKGTIPVPLLHLAAVLRKGQHEVTIFDYSTINTRRQLLNEPYLKNSVTKLIAENRPDLIGVNCFTSLHFPFTRLLCKLAKTNDSTIPVVVGGAHPSLFAQEILENEPHIDFIALGEGELQFEALANSIGTSDGVGLHRIPALAFRDPDGKVVVTRREGYISDLDKLPMPAWDLIDLHSYSADHSSWYNPKNLHFEACIPILTSRSCPYSCNFCACHTTMGRKFRKRSPQRVVDEIQMLHEQKGQNYFGFIDDNVNLDKKHFIEICREIVKRNLNIQYETTCGVHIASLNEEVIDAMADSGCVFVRLPIEHGNDKIRNKIIGKNLPREKIVTAVQNLKRRKIFTSSMFIMGFPEETTETLDDTYKLICELQLDLNYVFNLIPFPGTRVFKQASEDRLLIDSFAAEDLWKGEINLDPVQDECRFFIKPYNMSIDELMHYRKLFDTVQFYSKSAKQHNHLEFEQN